MFLFIALKHIIISFVFGRDYLFICSLVIWYIGTYSSLSTNMCIYRSIALIDYYYMFDIEIFGVITFRIQFTLDRLCGLNCTLCSLCRFIAQRTVRRIMLIENEWNISVFNNCFSQEISLDQCIVIRQYNVVVGYSSNGCWVSFWGVIYI